MKDKLVEIIKDEVCVTCGDSRLDIVSNIASAIRTYLIGEVEGLGYKISKPSTEKDEIIDFIEDGKILGYNEAIEKVLKIIKVAD